MSGMNILRRIAIANVAGMLGFMLAIAFRILSSWVPIAVAALWIGVFAVTFLIRPPKGAKS